MAHLAQPVIVPWIRLDRDAAAEEALALARARQPWCAGFCLFGGEAERVAALTARLRDAAGRPIFVASDMERGAGQQVAGLRVLPDAAVWGLGATPEQVADFGEITARDARSVGVDVLFAPVLDVRSRPDNPIVGNRAFGWDPDRVAALGAAFVEGALSGGCLPTAKHWPGHGATRADSHDAVPVVEDGEDLLEARDVLPFRQAIRAGCPAVMTAHVAYPALDPTGAIATFSRPMIRRLRWIADGLGQGIAVFTDALLMAGAAVPGGETEAARRALLAGCDALLIPSDPERLASELLDGAPPAFPALVAEAQRRIEFFVEFLDELLAVPRTERDHIYGTPGRVADRAARLQGIPDLEGVFEEGGVLLLVDDDDVPSRGEVLLERAARAGVRVELVRVRQGKPTAPPPADLRPDLVVVFASVRAWKGSANLSPWTESFLTRVAGAAVPVVALAPRPVHGGLHLPGTGPDVETALADRLFAE